MKYNLGRKINPKRFFSEMQFENIEFYVEGADSPKQAMDEIDNWVKEWVKRTEEKIKEPSELPFENVHCGSKNSPSRDDYLNN